jgi:hypothetical protein
VCSINEENDQFDLVIDGRSFNDLQYTQSSSTEVKPREGPPSWMSKEMHNDPFMEEPTVQNKPKASAPKKDPLEFDNGFNMFDYKSSTKGTTNSQPAHKEKNYSKPVKQTAQMEWKPQEPEVEERGRKKSEPKTEDFQWDQPSSFQFDNQPKAPVIQEEKPRLAKPGIFNSQAQKQVPTAPPQPQIHIQEKHVAANNPPAQIQEKKEVAKPAQPVLFDLLSDTPAQVGLPQDLFDAPQPIPASTQDHQVYAEEEKKEPKPDMQYQGLLGQEDRIEQSSKANMEPEKKQPDTDFFAEPIKPSIPRATKTVAEPLPNVPQPKPEPAKVTIDWEKMINQTSTTVAPESIWHTKNN